MKTNTLIDSPFLAKISFNSDIRMPASTCTNPVEESNCIDIYIINYYIIIDI